MNNLSAGLQEYYRAVEREIPCSGKDKKRYLNDILQSLTNLQDEQPDAGYETAIMRIGAPENLGETAKGTIPAHNFAKQSRHNKRFKICAVAVLLLAVILTGAFASRYFTIRENMRGDLYCTETVTIYPEGYTLREILEEEERLTRPEGDENK